MATGPWLAWLPLEFLERLTEPRLRPVPTQFGRRRHPDRLRRPAFGRGPGAVPGAGKRGARRGAGTKLRVSGVDHAGRSLSLDAPKDAAKKNPSIPLDRLRSIGFGGRV